jgi:hypothetical protein
MDELTEASEEVLWTAGFAVVTAVLLFALFALTSWPPPCWVPGQEPSDEVSPTGQLIPVLWSGQ